MLLVTVPNGCAPNQQVELEAQPGQSPLRGMVQDSAVIGLGAPLSTVVFVDGGTAIAVAQQNGSISAPFATIQQAVNWLEGSVAPFTIRDGGVIYVCPGTYNENVTVSNINIRITALGVLDAGLGSNAGIIGVPAVAIQTVTFTRVANAWISITGCRVQSLVGPAGSTTVTWSLLNCFIASASLNLSVANIYDSVIGVFGVSGITCNRINAENSSFQGPISQTSTSASSFYRSCVFSGGGDITTAGGLVQFDGFSNWAFKSVSNTITGGRALINDALGRATLTVNVPVLLAGVIGVVAVSTVGTELEGIGTTSGCSANEPVAGVAGGGALVGVRVTLSNQITFKFLGPCTGGNQDFIVARTTNRD